MCTEQNGNGSENGDGDISLFGFTGNALLQDVVIFGGLNPVPNNGNADFAIQINGRDPVSYDVTHPIGNVVFDDVQHEQQLRGPSTSMCRAIPTSTT